MNVAFIAYLHQQARADKAIAALSDLVGDNLNYKHQLTEGGPHILGCLFGERSYLQFQLITAGDGLHSRIKPYFSRIEEVELYKIRRMLLA